MPGDAMEEAFGLAADGATLLSSGEYAFPAASLPPMNESPGFRWTGVPKDAKSLALVFTDTNGSAGPAYKWVIWDIPPTVTRLPANVSSQAMPAEVAGASQLGSLSNKGYAGPCCADRIYEFVLWALDVEKLPDTAGRTTAELRETVLPTHDVATTKPVKMRIMP
jgi:Raf kinase inhibitor-like YbhB/YbcL family protein